MNTSSRVRPRTALLGGMCLGVALGVGFSISYPQSWPRSASPAAAEATRHRVVAPTDTRSTPPRARAPAPVEVATSSSLGASSSDESERTPGDPDHPLDLAVSSVPYSPLGSMGNPWVSRFQWSFVGSSVDWRSTDPAALGTALALSLAAEKSLLATAPSFDDLIADQPWCQDRFQCFAFLGSAMEAPLPALFVLGGRDYSEQASPEASLRWWEAKLGPFTENSRSVALEALRDYERERRREVTRAIKLLFGRRPASERMVRPTCIGVVQNRLVVLDSALLPSLSLLDAEYRELSNSSWQQVLRALDAPGDSR